MKLFNKIREQQLKKRRLFYEETLDMQFSLKLHNGKMYILRDNKPVILLSFDLVHLILQPRYRSLVDDRASRRCANVRPYFPYFLKPE